jgi:pilus assembly protein CpaE
MRLVIAVEDGGQRAYLRQVALSLGLECDPQDCILHPELPMRLAQSQAHLVLVVVAQDAVSATTAIRHAAGFGAFPVLAAGASQSPQLILQLLRAGAREYLDQSRLRDELSSALTKLSRSGAVTYRPGQVIAVMAVASGAGVTTVANSLAFALGDKHPQRVALAELGAGVPELALALDVKPRHTVADVAQNWERLDAMMLAQTIVPHPAGVHMLVHQPETLLAPPLLPQAMQQTLLLLKVMYDYVVLDLGHQADGPEMEALSLAEQVLVVVRLDVPALRLTRRLLEDLIDRGVPRERIRLVANRYGQRKQIGWKDAEKTLGMPILEYIPDDPTTLNAALNQGVPLVRASRRAGITRSFDKLAARVNGKS